MKTRFCSLLCHAHARALTHTPPPPPSHFRVPRCYGGMWYAIIEAADFGLTVTPADAAELVRVGEMASSVWVV